MVCLQSEPPANEPAVDPQDKGAMPDELAAQKDSHRLLFKALDALGSPDCRCRQLIECVIFGDLTYQEAAQLLEMKEKTVSSALSRCLAELRQIYLKLFPGENLPPRLND
jgi:RNA polymerase sigma factor (sigma-70 family)